MADQEIGNNDIDVLNPNGTTSETKLETSASDYDLSSETITTNPKTLNQDPTSKEGSKAKTFKHKHTRSGERKSRQELRKLVTHK